MSRDLWECQSEDFLKAKPLVVDLDGTLTYSDMLHESAIQAFRESPCETLRIPFLLVKGKAFLKQYIASRVELDPSTLPYNLEFLEWLRQMRNMGRSIVLCTASDRKIANLIYEYLGIFDEVIASDGITNISGEYKAKILLQRFGHNGYDYAGNSYKDLAVWKHSEKAIVVNGSDDLVKKARKISTVERVFPPRNTGFFAWSRVLRIHQWLKNLLLFIPLFAAHDLGNGEAWAYLLWAFVAFSLCASSVYIINDLLDLESDRLHNRKRHRPFASGLVPACKGVLIAPVLLIASLTIALLVGKQFLFWLIFYFALTCAYSLVLKRLILIDCLTLALLYTLRIIAATAAIGQEISFWLLTFSVFIFLSLAFVKRYAELKVQLLSGQEKIHGRGYQTVDAQLIQTMGIVAGYISVVVLALYLNSDAVLELYELPKLIWGAVLLMLFWISWMWMQAHRGKMHDDPLIFAFNDKASLSVGAAIAVILFVGAVGISW